ncbi:hypothetical protein ACJJTC_007111 [Scirpophaga incertulas]
MESIQKTVMELEEAFKTHFASFKVLMLDSIINLTCQLSILSQSVERLELQGRRRILLLHGIPEDKSEELSKGRAADGGNPRPILIKFLDVSLRDKIWFAKTKLKGSGVTLSEFLTRSRHALFMAAREKLGVKQCWTKEGNVYVLGSDGSRHRILTLSDIHKVEQKPPEMSSSPIKPPAPSKLKRTVRK